MAIVGHLLDSKTITALQATVPAPEPATVHTVQLSSGNIVTRERVTHLRTPVHTGPIVPEGVRRAKRRHGFGRNLDTDEPTCNWQMTGQDLDCDVVPAIVRSYTQRRALSALGASE